ncbi:hypothetical protein, partial [Wenjunlia tyrosinilytica]|uniref:hypothetical protein n=1 Tax=Wenjunlia tyrosinilytica TaxID=1544741 RepID=UPI001664ABC2
TTAATTETIAHAAGTIQDSVIIAGYLPRSMEERGFTVSRSSAETGRQWPISLRILYRSPPKSRGRTGLAAAAPS